LDVFNGNAVGPLPINPKESYACNEQPKPIFLNPIFHALKIKHGLHAGSQVSQLRPHLFSARGRLLWRVDEFIITSGLVRDEQADLSHYIQ
jgi:hypothetical protein